MTGVIRLDLRGFSVEVGAGLRSKKNMHLVKRRQRKPDRRKSVRGSFAEGCRQPYSEVLFSDRWTSPLEV